MKRPNFFIVGAPKCGTTALAHYLSEHPQVFVCNPKEPSYFARHHTSPEVFRKSAIDHVSLSGYLLLFERATDDHLAVGDASTRYLRSERALREIRDFSKDARIIVHLRNPVDLAHSWYSQKRFEGQEPARDFETAWRLQEARARGEKLPANLMAEDDLLYRRIASLGSQVESLLGIFDRSRVHFVFLDDVQADPRSVYESTLRFLGVESDGREDFPVINAARTAKNPELRARLLRRPRWMRNAAFLFKQRVGVRSFGVTRVIDRLLISDKPRSALSPDLRSELTLEFSDEVRKLEALTKRNLSHWRESH